MAWSTGTHHAAQLTSAVDTDFKTNTPSMPRSPERVAVTIWGPSESLQPGGLSDLAQARAPLATHQGQWPRAEGKLWQLLFAVAHS